jgi:threonine dehydrogenase-like Zn-dependent dehydrogenase
MTVCGSMGYYRNETKEALALIANGRINRDMLITKKFSLEEAADGFVLQSNPFNSVKILIVND